MGRLGGSASKVKYNYDITRLRNSYTCMDIICICMSGNDEDGMIVIDSWLHTCTYSVCM